MRADIDSYMPTQRMGIETKAPQSTWNSVPSVITGQEEWRPA
jgi:hypothetical protein